MIKKFLFTLSPESAHDLVKFSSFFSPDFLAKKFFQVEHPSLIFQDKSLNFSNPLGLAAGFDKNAEMISLMEALGFGFLEIGSITHQPYQGNAKPRIFRLVKDQSIINRMGLPNLGAEKVFSQLKKNNQKIPLGINIAKKPSVSKSIAESIDDYLGSIKKLHQFGDYFTINLSCPNTNDGKTFEDPKLFSDLSEKIDQLRKDLTINKPFLIKISPDTVDQVLTQIIELSLKYHFNGFVVGNTSSQRINLATSPKKITEIGRGGLSGKALTALANQKLKFVKSMIPQNQILMGVGGIMSFEDLLEKLKLGADVVQIYTGLVFNGPSFIKNLNLKLINYCQKNNFSSYLDIYKNEQ